MKRGGCGAVVMAGLAVAVVPHAVDGAASSSDPRAIAITGGRVVTVSGPTLAKGTVVIAGGKIVAIGETVAVPRDATVIDATGRTVYPGLIDAMTTIGITEIAGGAAGTVDVAEVGDMNPHAKAAVALNPHSDLIPVARAAGLTAALSAPRGGLVSGQSALVRLAGHTPAALTVKGPVALHVTYPTGRPPADEARMAGAGAGADLEPKTFAERQREKKKNQDKELRRLAHLLEEAKAYGAALDAARAGKMPPPRVDLPMEAMVPAARGRMPVVMAADDDDDIRGAIKFAVERGLKLIISGGAEAWRCTDVLKKHDIPVLLTVDRLPRKESDPYDAQFTNPGALQAAGVRFAIVSDQSTKARNLPFEAAMARAYGLPADAALRAITLSPAEILGVGDRMGSLAEGKDANIIIATGDIMDHRTDVTHVFIDGQPQSMETRHTRLWKQFKDTDPGGRSP